LNSPAHTTTLAGLNHPLETNVTSLAAIWALELALVAGILTVIGFGYKGIVSRFAEGTKAAVAGSLLAAMNTASEYGFGAVIAESRDFLSSRMRWPRPQSPRQ
jgi:H+/gluconate symporter-like permease